MITEQIGDRFGITVQYEPQGHFVEFTAYEVLGVGEDDSQWYWRKGAVSSTDDTSNLSEAEPYIKGSVKWDGCSHFNFGDEGYLHLCGRDDIDKLANALSVIYERCGALMKEAKSNLLEGEFECASP